MTSKITTGANDRPKDETIAQTGGGIPDDSGRAVEVDDAEVDQMAKGLKKLGAEQENPEPPYDVTSEGSQK